MLTALWTLHARSPIRSYRAHSVSIRTGDSARQKKVSSPDQTGAVVAQRAALAVPAAVDFEPTAEHAAVVAVVGSFPGALQVAAEVSVVAVAPAAVGEA